MPVYKILSEMPYEEYVGWCKYMNERPEGWKEDMRTYHVMSAMATMKKKPEEIFPTIKAVLQSGKDREVKLKEGAMPAGNMLARMMQAKGGDGEFDIQSFVKGVKDGQHVRGEHEGSEFSSRVEESGFRS